jgi:hypothetical protein
MGSWAHSSQRCLLLAPAQPESIVVASLNGTLNACTLADTWPWQQQCLAQACPELRGTAACELLAVPSGLHCTGAELGKQSTHAATLEHDSDQQTKRSCAMGSPQTARVCSME